MNGHSKKLEIDIDIEINQKQAKEMKKKLEEYYEIVIVEKNKIILETRTLSQSELKDALLISMDCKRSVLQSYIEDKLLKSK